MLKTFKGALVWLLDLPGRVELKLIFRQTPMARERNKKSEELENQKWQITKKRRMIQRKSDMSDMEAIEKKSKKNDWNMY